MRVWNCDQLRRSSRAGMVLRIAVARRGCAIASLSLVSTAASSSGTMIRAAASISARCEKACGKLPRCRPVSASNSSA